MNQEILVELFDRLAWIGRLLSDQSKMKALNPLTPPAQATKDANNREIHQPVTQIDDVSVIGEDSTNEPKSEPSIDLGHGSVIIQQGRNF